MKILEDDLDHIWKKTSSIWDEMKNKTVFVTGGTGFFGIWLQMSFVHINRYAGLNAKMIVLTRNKLSFLSKYPWLQNNGEVSFIEGDICSFKFPEEKIDYIIHAATDASVKLNLESPLEMFETVVNGTKKVLELAVDKDVQSFLFISSGAVYGKQPSTISNVDENYTGGPDISSPASVYSEGKRMAEVLCSTFAKHKHIPLKTARCYAFVGPFLPIDTHFAIGNFINDILNKRDIIVKGDGSPYRSYLYVSDLAVWLWVILLKGENGQAYNVGSDRSITIEELAQKVLRISSENFLKIEISQPRCSDPVLRYVPSIAKARRSLGLDVYIDLDKAIEKTISFYEGYTAV